MAYTQEQLDDLEAAIAEGVTSVSSNGRHVTYRNLGEMLKLRDLMAQELGIAGTTADRIKILPITESSLLENHYAGGKDLLAQYYHNFEGRKLYNAKHLIVGGTGKIEQHSHGVFIGDLSAIIINNLLY